MTRRLVVIGAGPIGLFAALGAVERGFDVTVLERAEVGAALRCWGATRLFSPLSMNVPARVRELLGAALPSDDALLTGPEMVERVLDPLARMPLLAGRVLTGHRVIAVGRARLGRGELAGHPLRAERAFRLLVEAGGEERVLEAELVFDASGVAEPTGIGPGGLPARGERALGAELTRDLGALERLRPRLRRVLVLGHGHSAANALGVLDGVARENPSLRVQWVVRTANLRPCVEVASDPLPERQRVAARANDLAAAPPPWLTMQRRQSVEQLARTADGLAVTLSSGEVQVVDTVAALTGYRPDLAPLAELALDLSPVTEGLGRLTRALAHVTDCLSAPRVSSSDLESGEAGFFLVGAKSYGRARTFLIRTGIAHLETIFAMI